MHFDIIPTVVILAFLASGFTSVVTLCAFALDSRSEDPDGSNCEPIKRIEADMDTPEYMLKLTCLVIGISVIAVLGSGRPVELWWAFVLVAGFALGFIYHTWVQSW